MLNERPEGKDKFGYVLIGLLVAFVIILVTSAVIWNSNHPEKVQENFEKIDTQQAEEKKGAKLGPYTIQLKDKKVVDCVGGALYTIASGRTVETMRSVYGSDSERFGVVEQFHNAFRRIATDWDRTLNRSVMDKNLERLLPLAAHAVREHREGRTPDLRPMLGLCRRNLDCD